MTISYPIINPHTLSVEVVLHTCQTNAETGLSSVEANNRIIKFGTNVYQTQKQKSIWLVLLEQFKSSIAYLLVVGALVSVYFKNYIEAFAIVIVIFINATIGFLMEMQARSSIYLLGVSRT